MDNSEAHILNPPPSKTKLDYPSFVGFYWQKLSPYHVICKFDFVWPELKTYRIILCKTVRCHILPLFIMISFSLCRGGSTDICLMTFSCAWVSWTHRNQCWVDQMFLDRAMVTSLHLPPNASSNQRKSGIHLQGEGAENSLMLRLERSDRVRASLLMFRTPRRTKTIIGSCLHHHHSSSYDQKKSRRAKYGRVFFWTLCWKS